METKVKLERRLNWKRRKEEEEKHGKQKADWKK